MNIFKSMFTQIKLTISGRVQRWVMLRHLYYFEQLVTFFNISKRSDIETANAPINIQASLDRLLRNLKRKVFSSISLSHCCSASAPFGVMQYASELVLPYTSCLDINSDLMNSQAIYCSSSDKRWRFGMPLSAQQRRRLVYVRNVIMDILFPLLGIYLAYRLGLFLKT